MKILVCNKYWYNRGGDCNYSIALEKMLREHGHETAIFSMQYPLNFDTPWSKYFPTRVSFRNVKHPMDALMRPFGSEEVKEYYSRMLEAFRPDVVHLNNIHTQLSPALAVLAHRHGARVVWTLHDYKLICPRYDCRCRGVENCTNCMQNPREVIWNRCVKNSFFASLLGYYELKKWNINYLREVTDVFLCPSKFMQSIMSEAGIQEEKMAMLHNFLDTTTLPPLSSQPREDYICYIGRMSGEKGIVTLLKAVNALGLHIKMAGDGPLLEQLRQDYASDKVEFLGRIPHDQILDLLAHSKLSVVPSEWYENNPLSIVESLCMGTPVVGANTGGIPELITDENGMLFRSGEQHSLETVLQDALQHPFDYAAIAQKARSEFDAENYYHRLMDLYQL